MADTSEPTHVHREAGQSVANFWGECLAAAARGEDIELGDRHGDVVAVMVSKERYDGLIALTTHTHVWYSDGEARDASRCECGVTYGEYMAQRDAGQS